MFDIGQSWREVLLGCQLQRPLIHVPRRPRPRVLVGERQEPADQPLPRADRVIVLEPAGRLLRTPPPPPRPHPPPPPVGGAPHPRSIASTIASAGRSCTTPETSSMQAAPASSILRCCVTPDHPFWRADLAPDGMDLANWLIRRPSCNPPETPRDTAPASRPATSRPLEAIPESSGTGRRSSPGKRDPAGSAP